MLGSKVVKMKSEHPLEVALQGSGALTGIVDLSQCPARDCESSITPYIGASINRATPKSSMKNWIFFYKPSIWGTSIYGNPHIPNVFDFDYSQVSSLAQPRLHASVGTHVPRQGSANAFDPSITQAAPVQNQFAHFGGLSLPRHE